MDVFIDGFLSGSIQSVVGHPFDTIKTRIQTGQQVFQKKYYRGFYPSLLCGCFQNGFLFSLEKKSDIMENKLFSGFVSGCLTSILVCPLEKWKTRMQLGINGIDPTPWSRGLSLTIGRDSIGFASYFYSYELCREKQLPVFWSGGIAGVISWVFSYPFDFMKTQVQTGMRTIHSRHGLGLAIVMSRAFLVNGAIFYSFENLKKNWK